MSGLKLRTNRPGFTLMELLLVIAIVSTLACLILPGLLKVREEQTRTQCSNNIGQLLKGSHNCHGTIGMLPPTMDWFPAYNSESGGDQEGYGSYFWHIVPYLE
jgi:prepilin-type N-terminal cleavage/methylation domain-containing protein